MRILLIRHGDPDYAHDSLTEKGRREAALLAERLVKTDITKVYVSSMGRAKETASYYLAKAGREADGIYDWMREFHGMCVKPGKDEPLFCWDWLPGDWTKDQTFFSFEGWKEAEAFRGTNVVEEYDRVTSLLDSLLAEHGYVREGELYRAERPNNDTIALFCHFGVGSVMLSHILNIPPMVFWHGFAAAPTSVSTIYTEERREGKAYFRMASYGDISHLYAGGEEPSFSARFCECYKNADERHD